MPESYARPELLAEPDWLWAHRDDPNLRVIDCGSAKGYSRAHIPGAVRLLPEQEPQDGPPGQWLKDPEDPIHVMGPEVVAALMGRLGVSDETTVLAYDDYNGTFATRLWWVLTYYGHSGAKVLNGGWQRWVEEGRPVTFRETVAEPGRFTPRPDDGTRIQLDELLTRRADASAQIVNVLWPEMYAGTANPFGSRRVGHIPGSVNLPIERFLVSKEVPTLKPAGGLRAALAEAGLSPDRETIVHCYGGIRTTMGIFVTSLLGWDHVRA
ncbi:MAG: rhodanese-like domain-containing protein, partial [Chloroflexota bacterium]|nr:rhodanese-like domain-containing protein [Chloroflexota bacterium]